jgi:predicted transposase/invertase (TIGR01784 family)
MRLGIDPKVDIAFKRLFGSDLNALLLIHLLHAILQPVRQITGLEIVQAHSEKETLLEKQTIADIKARDQGKRHFHLEMQWQVPWFFRMRLLFYWAKFHSQRLRAGEYYQTLGPSITICFTNETIFGEVADYHLVFRLREEKYRLLFSDDLEIHLIELPKFTKTPEQLSSALDRWLYFLRHGADLDLDNLPASLNVPEIRRAMEVLTVFTQDELEREAYEQRLKAIRDQGSILVGLQEALEARQAADQAREAAELALKEGLEEAREAAERGIAHAHKTGLIGQILLCQEMLKQPSTPEAELTKLTQQDLAALLARLRKQLLPDGA